MSRPLIVNGSTTPKSLIEIPDDKIFTKDEVDHKKKLVKSALEILDERELEIINNVRHPDSRWYQYPYKTEE